MPLKVAAIGVLVGAPAPTSSESVNDPSVQPVSTVKQPFDTHTLPELSTAMDNPVQPLNVGGTKTKRTLRIEEALDHIPNHLKRTRPKPILFGTNGR